MDTVSQAARAAAGPIELADAQQLILAEAEPLPAADTTLAHALGRAAAEPVRARVELPPFDRTAMDGWVVRAQDTSTATTGTPATLTVDGDLAAGDAGDRPLAPGHARRISTGAPLPPGSDAIVRLEDGEEIDGALHTALPVPPGRHVRYRGEDVAIGSTLLQTGDPVDAAALPLLASSGVTHVRVPRAARVAVITTGSELVAPGGVLKPGQIYESNLTALKALAHREGCELLDLGIVRDEPSAIGAALDHAARAADLLLITGGVSVGPHDHVRALLDERDLRQLFWRVKIKPGKPVLAGRLGERWVLGLPGNPLSSVAGWMLFAAPLVRRLHGHPARPPATFPVRLQVPAGPSDNRTTLLTSTLSTAEDGSLVATPTEAQGSHMTASLAQADGFVIIGHGSGEVPAGASAQFLPLPGRLF